MVLDEVRGSATLQFNCSIRWDVLTFSKSSQNHHLSITLTKCFSRLDLTTHGTPEANLGLKVMCFIH